MNVGQRLDLTSKYPSTADIKWGLEHDVLNPEEREFLEGRIAFLQTPAITFVNNAKLNEALALLENL